MEHSTAPGFSNPAEWDIASYTHHPCDGLTGFESLMNHANTVLAEMVAEGVIVADELREW